GVLAITSTAFFGNNVDGDDAHGGAVFNNSSDDFAMTINYSHFGELLGVIIPPIPPIIVPGTSFDVVAAIGANGAGNTVTGTTANTAGGGAIFNNGPLLITGTSFVSNSSSNHGGAFLNIASVGDPFPQPLGEQVIIANSTFTLNSATNQGGAIQQGLPSNVDDLLILANVTIANNTAPLGDGIYTEDGESPGLSNFDDVYVVNSIIANDSCAGAGVGSGVLGNGNMSASGNNVVFGGTCDIRQQDGGSTPATPITTDPVLSSPELAFNLGNIFTVVLSIGNGSSASGTGDPAICAAAPVLNVDQRNLPLGLRPQGAPNCDIGAYESSEPAPAPEINVQGNAVNIPGDGSNIPGLANHTEFVTTTLGSPVSRTFTIQNTGNANLSITLPLTVPAGFTVTAPPSASIAGPGSSTFTVECTAASSGLFAGVISITNDDSDENPYEFNISCFVNAPPPDINVRDNGDTLDILNGDLAPDVADGTNFGTTIMGFPISNSFIIENVGGSDLNVNPAITLPAGFTLTSAPTSNIPAGNTTTFTVECDADTGGIYNGSVLIASDDPDENPYEFAIRCIVDAPEINVRGNGFDIPDGDVTPTGADGTDFGTTTVGSPLSSSFLIQNTGTFSLTVNTTVTVPAGFTVTTPPTSPVATSSDTTFIVECTAAVAGPYSGIVSITNNDSDENPYTFTITCDVTATPEPEIDVFGNATLIADDDVTPDLADDTDFGATTTGTAISRTYTIENNGTANLTFGAVTVPAGFTVTLQPTSPVTPGNSATFTVQCDALAPAPYSGNVSFTNNDSDEDPFNFIISCLVNPTVPEINVQGNLVTIVNNDFTPDVADHTEFMATTTGTAVTRTFTIQNIGTGPLTFSPISLPVGFSMLTLPTSPVGAGGNTTFTVQCDAAAPGPYAGNVSFTNNDSDEDPFNFAIFCLVNPLVPEINVQG
ncbi:MAG TPA: choice-of-anchor D domain-containing protein, partial [Aggregatilineales bacterium]|nr:choice-of-anchor D domain-containing protein [Aggregatilineales bacterium]